jgi:hypothetical protein
MVECTNSDGKDRIFNKFILFNSKFNESICYIEPTAAGMRGDGSKTSLHKGYDKFYSIGFFNNLMEYKVAKKWAKDITRRLFLLEDFKNWETIKNYIAFILSRVGTFPIVYFDPYSLNGSFLPFIELIKFLNNYKSIFHLAYIPLQGGRNPLGEEIKEVWKEIFKVELPKDYNKRVDIIVSFIEKETNLKAKILAKFDCTKSKHRAIMVLIGKKEDYSKYKKFVNSLVKVTVNIEFKEPKIIYNNLHYGENRKEELLKPICPICGKEKRLDRLTCCEGNCSAKYAWIKHREKYL